MKSARPTISPCFLRFFIAYTRRYAARHFHAVRLRKSAVSPDGDGELGSGDLPHSARRLTSPLVIYLNHPSWWDPLIAMLLADGCFPGRPSFAPMDSAQLQRYGIFRKLGVFGVERGTARGARDFLRASEAVLTQDDAILWLTPQARFADVRERPLRFATGLAGLARRFPRALFLPLALEYAPWGERLPEVFGSFGQPISGEHLREGCGSSAEMTQRLGESLGETLDQLAGDVISRDSARFRTVLTGARGISVFYDAWRRLRTLVGGETFHAEHNSGAVI